MNDLLNAFAAAIERARETAALITAEEPDFPECEPCGLRSEDVETCDHLVDACSDCRDEGACVLCSREREDDLAVDFAIEDGAA